MNQNKKYNARVEHKKAKWTMRFAMAMTAAAGYFGWSAKNANQELDASLNRESIHQTTCSNEVATLRKQLAQAELRAKKAEKLNAQTQDVLADAMPAYTTTGVGNDADNAKEKARYEQGCKKLGLNPEKLAVLYEKLTKTPD